MLNDTMLDFVRKNRTAIMITTRKDGSAHSARVTAAVVDGKVVCTGTQTRVRTKHVRQNGKATFVVFATDNTGQWLGIESNVVIHEGPDVPDRILAMRRANNDEPKDLEAFRKTMIDEQRLVYEFQPTRVYGRYQ